MNRVSLEFNRGFYRRPRGGYNMPNQGSINTKAPRVVVRLKGSKTTRPAQNQAQ
ncbi:hypothetical protein Dthio_PD3631 [Desulfonatronospira thiodismutans ASO3-1]|uniref:Uncharacterized protein n=1 Tax=Desulfonatronospira thiodismutans ASO3-1 TaxID=555779 RepID=D6SJX2_9BACT|nr:hypothetical protein [Desulfonatronospira thiodismutans]EFI36175.1 hypothetical protein Dthio_PD3631 [Desulfonatronospira thiodismutans ASO3-1]